VTRGRVRNIGWNTLARLRRRAWAGEVIGLGSFGKHHEAAFSAPVKDTRLQRPQLVPIQTLHGRIPLRPAMPGMKSPLAPTTKSWSQPRANAIRGRLPPE
jgi:hypothetical protein